MLVKTLDKQFFWVLNVYKYFTGALNMIFAAVVFAYFYYFYFENNVKAICAANYSG